MQIEHNANLVDHRFTPTPCCHTKVVSIKMFYKCIPKINDKYVSDQPIGHLSNYAKLNVVDLFLQS